MQPVIVRVPKPPQILVLEVTHHSVQLSWEPYHAKLSAAVVNASTGRLKVEVELRRASPVILSSTTSEAAKWETAYLGYDTKCVCDDLTDTTEYQVRFRFGNTGGWGEFSDPVSVKTARRRYTSEDVHRYLRRQDEAQLRQILVAREANVDAPDSKGFSALQLAAIAGWGNYCSLLIEFGACVDWCGETGKTALMMAAYKGVAETVEILLDAGAGIDKRDRLGASVLHHAVDGEKTETVRMLLSRGADPSARDSAGRNPLTRCAMLKNNGNPEVAATLLQAGLAPDYPDSLGQTALFYCSLNNHLRMAELLLASGAKPTHPNFNGVTPLAAAEAHDRKLKDMMARYVVKKF